ncbi:DUF1176 domain-containing protein [Hansschlegelia plantiphila]|nr:DUF1176 domain-containing protein [Hansschlegelia plantiphila]
MKRMASLILALACAATPQAVRAQADLAGPLKSFKDWTVGCDNLRACVALGLAPEEDANAYVRIERGAGAADEPLVAFAAILDTEPKAPTLAVALDGKAAPGLPSGPIAAVADGPYARAKLAPAEARAFIAALKSAKSLTLAVRDGSETVGTFKVSLAGSAAALLFLDDQQKRVGGVTALVSGGPAASSAVPPAPAIPVISAVRMTGIDKTPPTPRGVKRDADADCDDVSAIRLTASKTLWAVCETQAAYNTTYRMWIAEGDTAAHADFLEPGATPSDDSSTLTWPTLSEDGLTMAAFDKGRGLGDCGQSASWAFDGSAFRLVSLARVDDCRGVSPDDWPTLYRARPQRAG